MRKIGIFGGTFNPIHKAHIQIVSSAREQLKLDFVIIMTGGNPPHKDNDLIYDGKIRHLMVKKAIKDIGFLIPCDYEINRSEYSYSVDTLKFLKRIYPEDELYFIIGGDSYSNFHKWYKPEEMVGKDVIVVCNLKPVKLRGVESQGMILAAGNDGDDLVVPVAVGAKDGCEVR